MAGEIDKKIDLIASADQEFFDVVSTADQQLINQINLIFAKFVKDKNLVFDAQQMAQLEQSIIDAIGKTDYSKAVNGYLPNFDAIQAINKDIHQALNQVDISDVLKESDNINNFVSSVSSQLKGTPSTLIRKTTEAGEVITTAVRNPSLDQLIDPIAEVIRKDVITGISFESATLAMEEAITKKRLGLSQWSDQIESMP